jgi:hypothetical protein
MKKSILITILFLSLASFLCEDSYSQDAKAISPYITLQYFKNTEGQQVLQTTLTYSKNRAELPLTGMEISFYSTGEKNSLMATIITDNKGIARYELKSDFKDNSGKNNLWAFSSEFRGNDTIEAGKSEITIKDVSLDMELTIVDTIKTINIKAFIKEDGVEKPVVGEAVKVYVPRMFSHLLISELTLDDNGSASVEFPSDLPGDKEGNLTLIAKFEENEKFGNVEKSETLKWGLPTEYLPTSHRALWTKTAPKWMIYTLSVLLAGVWGHYLFAIISLIRIKISAKKLAKEEYRV